MQIHQPSALWEASVFAVPVLIMLGTLIFIKDDVRSWAARLENLALLMGFIFLDLHFASRAFDLPHHDSPRTSLLELIAVILFWMGLFSVFWARRNRKKSPVAAVSPELKH